MPVDYSKYPPNWFTEIRPRILKRAKNCCEFDGCDFQNGETVYSVKDLNGKTCWERNISYASMIGNGILKSVRVVLTVAHLDHDEENHDVKDDRLKAFCQLCHLRYDAKEKLKRRKNKHEKKRSN